MTPQVRALRSGALALVAAFALLLGLAGPIAAHAELVTATPENGATVSGEPPLISGTYSETLDPDGSSLVLVGADGKTIATGGVADASQPTKEMSIETVPTLEPGEYTVKSTTKSADDGDLDRTTWSFTVTAAASPSVEPSAAASATIAPTPSAQPTASTTVTAGPSPSAPASAIATEGTAPPGTPAGSSGDVVLPIIVALIVVLGATAYLVMRRGRSSGTP